MRRIHITGGPGTGKSTLARALASRHGYDVLELDSQALSLPPASNGLRDFDAIAAARLSETEAWAAGDYWISEGSNVLVAGPLFERADTIVVLYTSWRVASYRILARHFKAELARNNRFPGLRNLYRFWRWSSRYYANAHPEGLNEWGAPRTQTTLEEYLRPFEARIIRCRTKADIAAFLSVVGGSTHQEGSAHSA